MSCLSVITILYIVDSCSSSFLPYVQQIDVYLRLDPDIERAVAGEKLNQRLLRNPRTVDQLGGGHISKSDPVVDRRSAVPRHHPDLVRHQRIGIGCIEVFEVPDEFCAIRFRQLEMQFGMRKPVRASGVELPDRDLSPPLRTQPETGSVA